MISGYTDHNAFLSHERRSMSLVSSYLTQPHLILRNTVGSMVHREQEVIQS
jgi:hypothetical protein